MKGVIRVGDRTSHGGQVVTGCEKYLVDGKPIARVGDECTCPVHGHTGVKIVEGHVNIIVDGKPMALHGFMTSCGATLITSMEDHGAEEGKAEGNTTNSTPAQSKTQRPAPTSVKAPQKSEGSTPTSAQQAGTKPEPQPTKTDSSKYAPIIIPDISDFVGKKVYGSGTCVDFPRLAAGTPPTRFWKKGPKPGALTPPGTVVATFFDENGTKYRSESGKGHVGAWLGMDKGGISIADQYRGLSHIKESYIRKSGTRNYNSNSENYFIVLFPKK